MKWYLLLAGLACMLPAVAPATTGRDLRGRIVVDGLVDEYDSDEWIVDESSRFPEQPHDSRWGDDNDIRRVALTWDDFNLYIAIPATTLGSGLIVFIDTACGGVTDLNSHVTFRRNIRFSAFEPDFILLAGRTRDEPTAGFEDCNTPFNLYETRRYVHFYRQDDVGTGALELGIPWELLGAFAADSTGRRTPVRGQTLGFLAAVTGGPGTGAGDAAPDPSVLLESDSTRVATLNNHATLPLDADGDGVLDTGVSPRDVVTFAAMRREDSRSPLPLQVLVPSKMFTPDGGERLRFAASLDPPGYGSTVFLSARVYSSAGHLVRELYQDEARDLTPNAPTVWDEWDGTDNAGTVVPGGVYVLVVSGGPGAGNATTRVKAAFAVVR